MSNKKEEIKNQGQGEVCECGHHQFYHTSYGNCLVLNCKCKEYYPKEEK